MVFAGLRRWLGKRESSRKDSGTVQEVECHPYRTPALVQRRELRENFFRGNTLDEALEKCEREGYHALFIPEVARRRISQPLSAPIWKSYIDSLSLIATGKTKGGKPVVVINHGHHYFSDWRNIRKARKEGLRNGAGLFPQEEFYSLLDNEDAREIFVLVHQTLMQAPYGLQSIDALLEHPFTRPFFGLPEQEFSNYLEKHKERFGRFDNRIGVWYPRQIEDAPLGRGLSVCNIGGLYGYGNFGNDGRFLGVAPKASHER